MAGILDNFKTEVLPKIRDAIVVAENDPTGNMGVRSIKNPKNPTAVVETSIKNNYKRWSGGKQPAPWIKEKPKKFVDFMQKRWAPVPAENDPEGLNKNWAPNVRKILKKMIGAEEYKKWQDLNIVKTKTPGATYG